MFLPCFPSQGFSDPEYRKRRAFISELASTYKQWVRPPAAVHQSQSVPQTSFHQSQSVPRPLLSKGSLSQGGAAAHRGLHGRRSGHMVRKRHAMHAGGWWWWWWRCTVMRGVAVYRREVYLQLRRVYPSLACSQFLAGLQQLEEELGYGGERIPQLREVSAFLKGGEEEEEEEEERTRVVNEERCRAAAGEGDLTQFGIEMRNGGSGEQLERL